MGLTAQQLHAIQASERSMSTLSLAGSLFIIGTFIKWHYFRKPINRLVFYASFGNIMANVATTMSTSPVSKAGESPSHVCRFQGVLIQWFMMADSMWVLCMALNVMLVFFHRYDSRRLRRLEKWYLSFAYGIPLVPALIYLIVEKAKQERIYGPATIWCWIDHRVEWMRIAFFYAPVWVVLVLTITIYFYTGIHIYKQKKRNISSIGSGRRSAAVRRPTAAGPFMALNTNRIERTTEISVKYTTDSIDGDSTGADPNKAADARSSFSSTQNLSASIQASPSRPHFVGKNGSAHGMAEITTGVSEAPVRYEAAIAADNTNQKSAAAKPQAQVTTTVYNPNGRRTSAMDWNSPAWSYFKVAFLMFAALVIVWVPSTVNRVQQFLTKGNPIFGLNLASAMVLPLQGFWNSMVYISTTWPECKRALQEILDHFGIGKHRGRPSVQMRERSASRSTRSDPDEFDAIVLETRGETPSSPADALVEDAVPSALHTCASTD